MWAPALLLLIAITIAVDVPLVALDDKNGIPLEDIEDEKSLYKVMVGDEPMVEGESLYDRLTRIQIHANGRPRAKINRVTFNRGGSGVKKDDVVLSDEQNDWLFGGNEVWQLRNHTSHEPDWKTFSTTDETFDPDFWNNTHDYLDIVESPEQPAASRRKRAGFQLHKKIKPWSGGIVPYTINMQHFEPHEIDKIREAMNVYEDLTCIKFVTRTNERQWINLHHTDDGCYSMLGDASAYNPGPQPVSLQRHGCRHIGTYLHELGHALGMVHEHQLPTRDNFVRYYGTNVDPLMADQLEIYNPRVINTFGTPYDLGSIMHYEIRAFSYDDMSPTLGVDNPWLAQHIGRRYSPLLSFGDVKTINELYQCDRGCKTRCPEGTGYVTRRCECITWKEYMQENCRDEDGMDAYCNKITPLGKCDIRNYDHHKSCARTCGFCPRFKPGDTAIGTQQTVLGRHKCMNRYHEPQKCAMWQQYCSKSPWMHRYCRATCQACTSQFGDCPNTDADSICDHRAKKGQCGTKKEDKNPKEFIKVRCQDSCGSCGARNMDYSCRNELSDTECGNLAAEQNCEKNPLVMFKKCPSTCNRCYLNNGSCRNRANEKECLQMALKNLCVAGGKKMLEMRQQCPKTCDSC